MGQDVGWEEALKLEAPWTRTGYSTGILFWAPVQQLSTTSLPGGSPAPTLFSLPQEILGKIIEKLDLAQD